MQDPKLPRLWKHLKLEILLQCALVNILSAALAHLNPVHGEPSNFKLVAGLGDLQPRLQPWKLSFKWGSVDAARFPTAWLLSS